MPQRPTELDEMVFSGPFGGIQSELPLRMIEDSGFHDILSCLLLNGQAIPQQTLNSAYSVPNLTGPITGIFDFFNAQGTRISGVFTPTNLYYLTSGPAWISLLGTITSSPNFFSWTIVAGKLCFSQGIDPIQMWDGSTSSITAISGAPPAFHVGELNNHLIACPVLQSGSLAPQRIMWSGAGDPTDWTSFDSGDSDLFNDLGPIRNWRKIYQQGYVFQQWGIVQQVPTGNAIEPWDFIPLSSRSKGLYYPWSLTGFGEFAIYVGKDNVYIFDGSSSQPIGDQPLQGRAWIGARRRILADLLTNGNVSNVYGYYTTSTNGQEFETYILVIPSASIWIYNMRESNWTRIQVTALPVTPTVVSAFYAQAYLQIRQLSGPISSQNWIFDQLNDSAPQLDYVAFGGNSGGFLGLLDLTGTPVACSLVTGSLSFGDTRHSKNLRKIRLSYEAYQQFDMTITARNEQGQTQSQYFVINANPGTTSYQVFPFHFPGVFITVTFQFNTTVIGNFGISEIGLQYDVGAEVRTQ